MSDARLLAVTPAEYYRDPCVQPSLTQSTAHTLLSESPLHAWSTHPRLGNRRSESTKALDDGSLVHALLLGKGAEVEVIRADSFRSKAAQEQRDAAASNGKLPVLEHQYAQIVAAVDAIKQKLDAFGIHLDGESEVAIEWTEPGEHGPVMCRGMMDHVDIERGQIIDLKKIRSAHPRTCSKHAIEYGYAIQRAAYVSALEKLRPDLAGRVEMTFVFVELDPPYAVVPAQLDGMLRELGERRWQRAVRIWERCLLTGHWPSYCEATIQLEAPAWALNQEFENAD